MRHKSPLLVVLLIAVCAVSINIASASNTVPSLTGTFTGTAAFTVGFCDINTGYPGYASPTGAYIFTGVSFDTWNISSGQTSMTGSYDPGNWCGWQFSGTTDGPITGTYGGLTFTGNAT